MRNGAYTTANDVHHPPSSVSYCRLVLLIRLALYQYGYVADVPLNRLFLGQAPEIPNRHIYSECGVPHSRISNLFNEISLHTLRRSEGYLESRAFDASRVGSSSFIHS